MDICRCACICVYTLTCIYSCKNIILISVNNTNRDCSCFFFFFWKVTTLTFFSVSTFVSQHKNAIREHSQLWAVTCYYVVSYSLNRSFCGEMPWVRMHTPLLVLFLPLNYHTFFLSSLPSLWTSLLHNPVRSSRSVSTPMSWRTLPCLHTNPLRWKV